MLKKDESTFETLSFNSWWT